MSLDARNACAYLPAGLPACMGGMCSHRDHCQRHVTDHREFVVERLCTRGRETPEPVFVTRFVEAEFARGQA